MCRITLKIVKICASNCSGDYHMSSYSKVIAIELIVLMLEIRCIHVKKKEKFYKEQNLLSQSVLFRKKYSNKEYRDQQRKWKVLEE